MKLNRTTIESLEFKGKGPKAKCIYWEEGGNGFGIRVWPTGKKVFLFSYRNAHRRQRYLTLGPYGALTPDQARKMAAVAHAQVLQGIDPKAEKDRVRHGETVADLCRRYIDTHSKPRNKTWEKDQERIDLYILPAWGNLRVSSISRADVSALHTKIWIDQGKGTTANRVLSLVKSMFNKARSEYGLLEPMAPNPAVGIAPAPEKKRKRFVKKNEMPELAKAIVAEKNVYAQAAIWGYLLTGLRKEELLRLRWTPDPEELDGHVDLERGEIYLPDTKPDRDHTLPLSAPALHLFRSIERMAGNPYVFCGARDGRPLVNISKPWLRIREEAKLLDVRLHDLRRTVGSWLAMSGQSLSLIGEVLNHSNVSTTQVYARFDRDPVAAALEGYAGELSKATGGLLPAAPAKPA